MARAALTKDPVLDTGQGRALSQALNRALDRALDQALDHARTAKRSPPARHAIVAVAALAGGGLAFEIALTRLLSALLASDVVGPVLAVAVGGLGLGAAVAAASDWARRREAAALAALVGAVAAALVGPTALWLAAATDAGAWLALVPILVAFTGVGWAVAATFAAAGLAGAALYRTDLLAAAAAAALAPLALSLLGGLHGSLAAAAVLALAAVALAAGRSRWLALLPAALPLALLATALSGQWGLDPARHMPGTPLAAQLERGAVLEASRWDATARTDLVRAPSGARYVFMDGGAGSLVPTADPTPWWRDVGAFAFAAGPSERVFLIGSGGGLDVAQARVRGAREIVAVEVNPASVALTRSLGADAGDVYEPPTEVVIGDGRRVLTRTAGTFDVIMLANVVTNAAERHRLRLTESRVYTVEAFTTYLSRLRHEGRLALVLYDEATLTRALTTALEALVQGGHAEDHGAALLHAMVVLDASSQPSVPILTVRRTPYTREEAVAAARVAEARGWALVLVPHLLTPSALAPLATGEAGLQALIAASPDVDLRPTTDAAPFFFAFEPGVQRDAQRAGVLAAALLGVFVLVPAARLVMAGRRLRAARVRASTRRLWTAIGLGLGFMLLELHALGVVQQVLGHPSWSLAATLGAVLGGGAAGAAYAARRPGGVRRPVAAATLAVMAWGALAQPLATTLTPWHEHLAAVPMLALLALAAAPLGVPFARLLVESAAAAPGHGPATAWLGSGVGALAAGATALWAAHAWGIPSLALLALAAYVSTALLQVRRARPSTGPSGAARPTRSA